MAKELDDIYAAILGPGETLDTEAADAEEQPDGQSEDTSTDKEKTAKSARAPRDAAYEQEDYGDDAEDGNDPREEKEAEEDQEKAVEDGEEPDDKKTDDDEGEVIDERLVIAGRRARLSDEAIIELAETRPEVLEALAVAQEHAQESFRLPKGKPNETPDDEKKSDKNVQDDALDLDDEEMDALSPKAKAAILKLNDRLNALSRELGSQKDGLTQIQRNAQQQAVRRIDEFFDNASEDLPTLGKSSSLSRQQADARMYAFKIARGAQLAFGDGMSDEEALAVGVNALKGQMKDSQLKAKIVSDLNRNKKRFTARYKGRRIDERKSADERAMEAINKVMDDPKYSNAY